MAFGPPKVPARHVNQVQSTDVRLGPSGAKRTDWPLALVLAKTGHGRGAPEVDKLLEWYVRPRHITLYFEKSSERKGRVCEIHATFLNVLVVVDVKYDN